MKRGIVDELIPFHVVAEQRIIIIGVIVVVFEKV